MSRFAKNNDGVHLLSPDGEYGVCGDAMDIGSERGCENMVLTEESVVTCSRCKEMIEVCRGVKCG